MSDYLPLECVITDSDVDAIFATPGSDPNFLTANYAEPTDAPECSLSIEIYYQGTPYEFTWFVIPDSVKYFGRYGEISTFQFDIVTGSKNQREVPFVPVPWMLVDIRNIDQNKRYFKGYTRHRKPTFVARNDSTYEEKQIITIYCSNLYSELERKKDIVLAYKVSDIPGLTSRYILRDVIRRYCPALDYTQIDPALGIPIEQFAIQNESPAEVLQRLLDLEQTTTFRIDNDLAALIIADKGSSDFMKSITINDENLYDYFYTDIDIEKDYDYIKNVVVFDFDERLTDGTVNVADGSDIVVGYTGEENWYNKDFKDGKFKLDIDTKYYSIAENNSDATTSTLEIILSNAFEDPAGAPLRTNQPYEIIGHRNRIVVRNVESINAMRSLIGGTGEFTDVIGGENRNALSFEEALNVAYSYLAYFAYPLVNGNGNTTNTKWPLETWFEGGDTINFNLPASKQFTGIVIIQQVDATLIPAMEVGADGNRYPLWQFSLDFSHNLLNIENQIKKLMMQGRKVTIVGDDSILTQIGIAEPIVFKNCMKVRTALTINENSEVSDIIRVRNFVPGPYYTWPTAAAQPAYTLGENHLSWTVP